MQKANIKMFLAAKFVNSRGCNNVSIQTVKNDVAILALNYPPMLSKPLYIKSGARKSRRILNLTEVASEKNFLSDARLLGICF